MENSSTQMGGNWKHKAKELINNSITPREIFYLITITLLSLLLPLSFLLLASLSSAQYYLQTLNTYHNSPPFLLFVLAFKINPFVLYLLVSIVSIASLIQGLIGNKITFFRDYSLSRNSNSNSNSNSRLCSAWILLCAFQVCVGLGIEGSIEAGVYDHEYSDSSFGIERSLLSRVIFLLGLHETTRVWSKLVVRPVVDDTVFGVVGRGERWVEKVAAAGSLGALWWWRLRDDVETLVVMAEVKKEQLMDVGVGDFVGWSLYYMTLMIGMVRVVKGLMWICMIFVCGRRSSSAMESSNEDNDDKV